MTSRVAGAEDSTVEAVAERLVSGLADLSERMGDREFALIADDSLLALVAGLERASRRLEALIVRAEGRLAGRCFGEGRVSLAGRLGCRDGLDVLELVTRRSRTVLRQRVRLAEDLQAGQGYSGGEIAATFPAIAEAFYAGDVSFETAQMIADSLRKVPGYVDPDRVAEAERCIVNQAAGYPEDHGLAEAAPGGGGVDGDVDGAAVDGAAVDGGVAERLPVAYDTVREICAYWTTALDQDGPEPDEVSVLTRRSFRMGRMWRGLVPVRGSLTPEVAALLGNLMTAINSPKTATNQADPTSALASDPVSGDADDFEPDLGAMPGDARSQG